MTTTYHVTYTIRKANGRMGRFTSIDFETENGARVWYENKIKDEKVRDAYLCKNDHYYQEELTPEAAWSYPYGKDCVYVLARYSRV